MSKDNTASNGHATPSSPKKEKMYTHSTEQRRRRSTKTVVILGAAYGGARAARMLAQTLPAGWRLVVIDRNSHMNHVYVFPRFSILPDHAPKAFIPYTKMLDPADVPAESNVASSSKFPTPPLSPASSTSSFSSHEDELPLRQFIQGTVTHLTSHSVSFIRPASRKSSMLPSMGSSTTVGTYDFEGPEETLAFDYCVYALGSGMPDPCNVWSEHPNLPPGIDNDEHLRGKGSKKCGVTWMEEKAKDRRDAKRVLIVGGGALGIQFATDLKEIYPDKEVMLLHSRPQLMPIYPIEVHVAAMTTLQKLGVDVVLGERVMTWPEDPEHLNGKTKVLTTDKGREFHADLVLPCTGQKPHTSFIAALCPASISPTTDRIRVHPTMQLLTHAKPLPSRANTTERMANLSLQPLPDHHLPTPPTSDHSDEKEEDLRHIFAIGDCAETGAIQAGHTAYWQAEVAARNVCRLIEKQEGRAKETLESYKPGPPCIKLTLGLTKAVTATGDEVVVSEDGVEDLRALLMWPMLAAGDCDPKE